MNIVGPLNLNGYEVRNFAFQKVATDPASPANGVPWYNTTSNRWKISLGGVVTDYKAELDLKAPLSSPALSGVPTAPTPAQGTNTTQIATSQFVITEIAARLAANDYQTIKGGVDCSANPNYPAAVAGDTYRVTVAGRIGGASGPVVEVGDVLICFVDGTASGNHATVGANWIVLQYNIDGLIGGGGTGTVNKYSALIGNGTLSTYTIDRTTHGLSANSQLIVAVSDATTGEVVYADVTVAPASGNVTISFGSVITSNAYRVTIIG